MTAASPRRQGIVAPDWLVNVAALGWRVLVTVALGAVVIFIAGELMTVTASVLVAVIVTATFAPFVLNLRDRGWSRTKAAGVVTLGVVLVLGVTTALIALAFIPYLPQVAAAITAGVAAAKEALAGLSIPPDTLEAAQSAITQAGTVVAGAVSTAVGSIASAVTIGMFALFLTFFFLQDGDKAWAWAFQGTTGAARERMFSAGHDALERVGGYLRGTAILASVRAVASFVFLYVLGVPLAAPLAVLVFLGNFIPYVGGWIATAIIVVATYATQGTSAVVILLILITIMNIITGNVLRPIIYGKTVDIHPALVLVALPAGAAVAGLVGLFVAIPVVAIVMAVAGATITILDPGPGYDAGGIVPGWLDRLAQWSWRLLVAIGLGFAAVAITGLIPTVAVAVVLAIVLAATLLPMMLALLSRGWRRTSAALTVTAGAFLVVVLVVGLTTASLLRQAAPIASTATEGASAVDAASSGALHGLVDVVQTYGTGIVAAAAGLAAALAAIAVVLVLAGLLCFYFLRDGEDFWHAVTSRLPGDRDQEAEAAGARAVGVLGGYMIGTGAISIFGAVTQFIIMALLGLPLALPLAVLAFFGGFIPYIGSFLTTLLAFLVAVAVGSTQDIIIMAVYTIVFNVVQGNFVAPLVYSRAVNLHPAVVLMAIPAGSEIAGVLGMFLAVPLIGVIATTWRTVIDIFASKRKEVQDASLGDGSTAIDDLPTAAQPDTRIGPPHVSEGSSAPDVSPT